MELPTPIHPPAFNVSSVYTERNNHHISPSHNPNTSLEEGRKDGEENEDSAEAKKSQEKQAPVYGEMFVWMRLHIN